MSENHCMRYFIAILFGIIPLYSANISTKITEIAVNGSIVDSNSYADIVICSTDSISFRFILDAPANGIGTFMYKPSLIMGSDTSSRSIGERLVVYTNLSEGNYTFEVSAFGLSKSFNTQVSRVYFEVNNRVAKYRQDIANLQAKHDSALVLSKESESIDANSARSVKAMKIGFPLAGFTILLFLALFVYHWRKRRKDRIVIEKLEDKIQQSNTNISTLEKNLKDTENTKEVLHLKLTIETITQKLEGINTLNASISNNVVKVNEQTDEFHNLQNKKKDIFTDILNGINNPADTIKGLVDLLRHYDLNVNDMRSVVDKIIDTTQRIIYLTEDIGRFVEFGQNNIQLNLDKMNIEDTIQEAIRQNITQANEKKIKISTNITLTVGDIRADRQKILVILYNLINNAIKYTPDGGKVRVSCYPKNNSAFFEVADNGIGINEEDLKKVYQKLATDEMPTDMGSIGLLTVKKYVEIHNGKVRVSSQAGKGAVFSFNIPYNL